MSCEYWQISAVIVVLSILGGLFQYYVHSKYKKNAKKFASLALRAEERVRWLDDESFRAFAAVCDTIVPSLSANDCSQERVRAELAGLCPHFECADNDVLSAEDALRQRAFLCAGALDYGTHRHCVSALEASATREEKQKLSIVLKLLSTSLGCLLVTGHAAPFHYLPLDARERALRSLRDSRFDALKALFHTFKRLVCGVYLSFAEPGKKNPAWEPLGYEPETAIRKTDTFEGTSEEKKHALLREKVNFKSAMDSLRANAFVKGDEVCVDAVVIGSGCGGGVVAHELVRAGFNVLVLEKGGFFQSDDFARWRESEAFAGTFEKSGLLTTADGNIAVLAGSCVGGGSTVNWSASFAPPRHVLEDWHSQGLDIFHPDSTELKQAIHRAKELFNVNTDNSYHDDDDNSDGHNNFAVNLNNRLLWKSAEKCGYKPQKIPRNVKNCVDCGHCTHGCSHDSKQSSWSALLEPLILAQEETERTSEDSADERRGRLFVIPNCYVERVTFEGEAPRLRATGVIASISEPSSPSKRKLRVKAKVVVSSCGSIHTPALLLRSGLKHRLIGKHLTLHPVLGCGGLVPRDKNTGLASGVSMGVVVNDPPIYDRSQKATSSYSPERHPVAIETPPVHMGILGLALPWDNGLRLKLAALRWRQMALFLGISRDQAVESNRVEIDTDGNPLLHYQITPQDKANLLAGLEAQLRMMRASGTPVIFHTHCSTPWFAPSSPASSDAEFEQFIERVHAEGLHPFDVCVFSAHQMSSCRMASDSSRGPVSPSGALFDCENLFVADGSVLPSSLGINPMLTIDTVALMISKNIISQLQQ